MPWRRIFLILLLVLLLLGGVGVVWFAMQGPIVAESMIVAALRDVGIEDVAVTVRTLRPSGADLVDIVVGDQDAPGLTVASVRLDYTPGGLVNRHLDRIVISGLSIRANWANNTLVIPGLDWSRFDAARPQSGQPMGESPIPSMVAAVVVQHSELVVMINRRLIRVPFSLQLRPTADQQAIAALLQLQSPFGPITLQAELDPAAGQVSLDFTAAPLALSELAALTGSAQFGVVGGSVNLQGSLALGLAPPRLISAHGTVDLGLLRLQTDEIRIGGSEQSTADASHPRLTVSGRDDQWQVSLTNLAVDAADMPLQMDLDAELHVTDHGMTQAGTVTLALPGDGEPLSGKHPRRGFLRLPRPERIVVRFDGELDRDAGWQARVIDLQLQRQQGDDPRLRFKINDLEIGATVAGFEAVARGLHGKVNLEYGLRLARGGASTGEAEVEVATVQLKGTAAATVIPGGKTLWSNDSSITADHVGLKTAAMALTLPRLRGSVKLAGESGAALATNPFQLATTVQIDDAVLQMLTADLRVSGISARLPFNWPPTTKPDAGEITMAGISWQGKKLGGSSLVVRQEGFGVTVTGSHDSLLVPGLHPTLSGSFVFDAVSGPSGEFQVNLPTVAFGPFDLDVVTPAAAGVVVQGDLTLESGGSLIGDRQTLMLQASLRHGRIEKLDQELLLEDVDIVLSFPDLLVGRSGPNQRFDFKNGSFGDLRFQNGAIGFQVESMQSLLIEQAGVGWSDGRVTMNGVRLSAAEPEQSWTLYCDRLRLASILEQFGIGAVEGTGTVSGFIPMGVRDKNLWFGDGFLYSAPGEGGSIRLARGDGLTANIPVHTPRFSQIDFAAAVLKNFTYNWAKLTFATEADELVMRMNLDGEPEHLLPFRYQQQQGIFVRLGPGDTGGIKQSIQLDVNFRLPLNQILEYGAGIGTLMDRLKQ